MNRWLGATTWEKERSEEREKSSRCWSEERSEFLLSGKNNDCFVFEKILATDDNLEDRHLRKGIGKEWRSIQSTWWMNSSCFTLLSSRSFFENIAERLFHRQTFGLIGEKDSSTSSLLAFNWFLSSPDWIKQLKRLSPRKFFFFPFRWSTECNWIRADLKEKWDTDDTFRNKIGETIVRATEKERKKRIDECRWNAQEEIPTICLIRWNERVTGRSSSPSDSSLFFIWTSLDPFWMQHRDNKEKNLHHIVPQADQQPLRSSVFFVFIDAPDFHLYSSSDLHFLHFDGHKQTDTPIPTSCSSFSSPIEPTIRVREEQPSLWAEPKQVRSRAGEWRSTSSFSSSKTGVENDRNSLCTSDHRDERRPDSARRSSWNAALNRSSHVRRTGGSSGFSFDSTDDTGAGDHSFYSYLLERREERLASSADRIVERAFY